MKSELLHVEAELGEARDRIRELEADGQALRVTIRDLKTRVVKLASERDDLAEFVLLLNQSGQIPRAEMAERVALSQAYLEEGSGSC